MTEDVAQQTGGDTGRQHVVVVGGGFGGVQAVRKLRRAAVDITLVDRRNFSLFQPLVYQVATGALSPEVTGFDLNGRRVRVDAIGPDDELLELPYDSLIVAGGSYYSYFGHDEWRPLAPDVKSLEGALEVRRRILTAFEAAEYEPDPGRRAAWLTFVVVGAGPTGVELAGQIAEIARDTLRRDFRSIDTRSARVLLVEMADRVLPAFSPRLSQRAAQALERLGVTPVTEHKVVDISAESVTLEAASGASEEVPARTVVWAAGVVASELAGQLATEAGAAVDRAGRVAVGPDLTLPGHPEVIALGDMVHIHDDEGKALPLPGLAPVAMQQGRYAGRAIRERLRGREPPPFHYRDKGNLATIGRAKAVADIKGLQLSGFIAWLTWLLVHLFYLIGFQNRLLVFTRWVISFVTHGRGERLITTEQPGDGQ